MLLSRKRNIHIFYKTYKVICFSIHMKYKFDFGFDFPLKTTF